MESSPGNGSYLLTLGLIQSARGEVEALETLRRAADMLPSSTEAQLDWAEAEVKACHRSEAVIGFTRALDHDGIDVTAGSPERLTARVGTRVSLAFQPKGNTLHAWSPYADLRYATTQDAKRTLRLSGEPLATGRSGRGIDVALGAQFDLGTRVTATVDAAGRVRQSRGGESGRTARLGLAVAL